ncbi:MAG TPA: SAM-dependent chlorinase/fluorinase, partial [Bacteroidota bacterium]|nr:SAM-dependent chlorinase/fluorinase [Bacteroidota bacterium]
MPPSTPVVALLTDFGCSDHYVASVKGTILSIVPTASIVDIAHDVEPQNVGRAAYLLWATYRDFPDRTVFITVVDPGVGTSRDIIVASSGTKHFIGPK